MHKLSIPNWNLLKLSRVFIKYIYYLEGNIFTHKTRFYSSNFKPEILVFQWIFTCHIWYQNYRHAIFFNIKWQAGNFPMTSLRNNHMKQSLFLWYLYARPPSSLWCIKANRGSCFDWRTERCCQSLHHNQPIRAQYVSVTSHRPIQNSMPRHIGLFVKIVAY